MADPNALRQAELMLIEALFHEDRLRRLANLAAEWLGFPLFFMDATWNVMAVSDNAPKDDLSFRVKSRNNSSFREYCKKVTEVIESGGPTPYIIQGSIVGRTRMIAKSYYEGFYVGHLSILETNRPLSALDLEAVTLVTKVYALAVTLENTAFIPYQDRPWHKLLRDLLSGAISTRTEFELRLQTSTTLYLPDMMKIAKVDSRSNNITPPLFKTIAPQFLNQPNCVTLILYEGSIAILFDVSKGEPNIGAEGDLMRIAKGNALYVGISPAFADLFDAGKYYDAAARAVLFAKRWRMQDPVQTYDSCKLYDLLTDVHPPTGSLRQYVATAVDAMLEYDAYNGTQYYETLKLYFQCNQNVFQTSERLFVHKTTLSYRLNKMQQLFAVDLKDPLQLLHLHMSIYILEMQLA